MSTYQHMSGAQKRKKKREEELKSQKMPKISTYFSAPKSMGESSSAPANIESVAEKTALEPVDVNVAESQVEEGAAQSSTSSAPTDIKSAAETTTLAHADVTGAQIEGDVQSSLSSFEECDVLEEGGDSEYARDITFVEDPSEEQPAHTVTSEAASSSASTILDAAVCEKYVTDRANYPVTISDPKVKRFIISHGPCRPPGPFPRDNDSGKRCFSSKYYNRITQTGLKLPVTWLCYSPKLNAVYCEPCWLFGDRKKQGFEPAWAKGIDKWKNLTRKIQTHENSNSHIDACMVYDQWRKKGTIDEEQEKQISQQKNFWRQVLQRIVNVTLTMSMANLPFRGHRERLGELNNGNFLCIVELLAEYDPILKELIQMPQRTIKYLSPQIQNEIIQILSEQVQKEIVSEIKQAQFYSVIMDTTQDIAKVDQLSQVFRYVSVGRDENTRATSVKIHEVFLGFHAVKDQSAAGIENDIIACIESKGLTLHKCRGQGYDGAATMSGIYSGVQARILEKEPNALYVHCAAHNLNLVLQDAMANIKEISNFYDVVQIIYTFFADSIRRWDILCSFTTESRVTLKKLCPTSWSSRYESLLALRFRFRDVMQALAKIILISTKNKEREEAALIKKKMESYEFIFLVVVQTKILENVNAVSKVLQAKNMDLSKASILIKNVADTLVQFRNQFQEAKQTAASRAQQWGIAPEFQKKRIPKVKRHFDELAVDERLNNAEQHFKVTVFYPCLDVITSQLLNRFKGIDQVLGRFNIIQPIMLSSASDDELFNAASNLQQIYQEDLTSTFPGQLLSFRSVLKEEILKASSVSDLAHLLLVDNSALSSTLPDVCVALLLFLTLPVTVASAERSFSKLRLIKNYLRSTMSEQRLSGLSLLSIENERARKLDIDSIVDTFAELKARRRML